jgi:hypothetical protein
MSKVTYGQLDQVLRSLGLTAWTNDTAEPPARLYEHKATGALIVLPVMREEEEVQPRHRLAVRSLLDAYGVTDPFDFDTRLQKAS